MLKTLADDFWVISWGFYLGEILNKFDEDDCHQLKNIKRSGLDLKYT